MDAPNSTFALSVVIPVCNEAENIEALVNEIHAALAPQLLYEVIVVDDGSTDSTRDVVRTLQVLHPRVVRLVRHTQRCGQSAALCTGVEHAVSEWVATLDGDGQNDPADIPKLLEVAVGTNTGTRVSLVMGHRVTRQDTWIRRCSSAIANSVRRAMLKDATPDTGCGIKVFHRSTFDRLPTFNHMHRFLPALFQRIGTTVVSAPVNHRPRLRGTSKYGIHNRLWAGIVDLFGVRWLIRRAFKATVVVEE